MKTYRLWARVGMVVEVTEEEKEEFLNDPETFVIENLNNGKVYSDGEIYFPINCEDNDKLGVGEE